MFSSKFWRVSPLSQRRGELDVVKDAVKDHRKELKKRVVPPRFMTDEEKVALTKGNSKAMIRANKEVFDYSRVREKDLLKAQKWFKAPKPFTGKGDTEYIATYYQWRLWNAVEWDRYKGGLIVEKATGKSVSSQEEEEEEE